MSAFLVPVSARPDSGRPHPTRSADPSRGVETYTPAMDRKDKTVAAARSGDSAAFETLFGRTLPRLVAFIRAHAGGIVADRDSATDLAQSVCREALEDLGGFDYRGEEEFRRWLFKRATRKIHSRHRWLLRERRDVRRESPAPTDFDAVGLAYADVTPSREAGAKEEVLRIEAALDQLPEPQREAISLTRIAGLSYSEVAEELGRSESAVRGLVMRGLARLAALLEQSEGDQRS